MSIVAAIASGLLLRFVFRLEPVAWLAWIAPVPILVLAARTPMSHSWCLVWLAALIANTANVAAFARIMPAPLIIVVVLAYTLVWGGVLTASVRLLRRGESALGILGLPLVWTAVDTLMATVLPDGNWGSPAYTQAGILPLVQVTSLLGVPGLLFLLMLVPSTIAFAMLHGLRPRGATGAYVAAALALAATVVFGTLRLREVPRGYGVTFGLAAIDDPIGLDATAPYIDVIRARYDTQVTDLARRGAAIIVLPEKIAVASQSGADAWQRHFSSLAAAQRVWLLASVTIDAGAKPDNIAWLFTPDGVLDDTYLKHHLAPPEREYNSGTRFDVRTVHGLRAGLAICKDMHFASFARQYGTRDVAVMLVPAWDFTVDRWMAARMTMVRGVENGYVIVRSSRDGLLTVSDAYGRVIAERASAPLPGASLLVTTSVPPRVRTPYSRFGDWFGWLCVAGAAALLVHGRRRGRAAG